MWKGVGNVDNVLEVLAGKELISQTIICTSIHMRNHNQSLAYLIRGFAFDAVDLGNACVFVFVTSPVNPAFHVFGFGLHGRDKGSNTRIDPISYGV